MCGIFGVVGHAPLGDVAAPLQEILKALRHRGPDDDGLVIAPTYALGHTRLSIIDLSARGRQPMWDRNGRVCVTFNGEIYNYRDLRRELACAGCEFVTNTDTEVLLEAYKLFGDDFLRRLDGMFAFCLYDADQNIFLLARDRLGVKPLYWAETRQGVVFGSEPKCILMWPGYRAAVDVSGLSQFLAYRQAFDATPFEGLKLLQPGHLMKVTAAGRDLTCYWRLDPLTISRRSSREAEAEFRQVFTAAVERQLVADVPIGLFLSGGLDSSMLLAAMSDPTRTAPPSFTASVAEAPYDETPYARLAARRYGSALEVVEITPEGFLGGIAALTVVKDLPLAMHNEVAVYHLAKLARTGVKVAMSGEGADEIAAGYGRLARTPFEHLKRVGRTGDDPDMALDLFLDSYGYFPFDEQRAIFRAAHHPAIAAAEQLSRMRIGQCWREASPRSGLAAVSHIMTRLHLPGLLQMMDSATMAAGLELRVPFTDHRLVELMSAMDDRLKLDWGFCGAALLARLSKPATYSERLDRTKVIYRKAYGRGLPNAILRRRKMGFPMPLGRWVAGPWRATAEAVLSRDDGPLWGLLDRSATRTWLEAGFAGLPSDGFGKKVWMLIALSQWLELRL